MIFHGPFDLLTYTFFLLFHLTFQKRLADDTKLNKGIRRQVSVNTKTSEGTTVNDIMLCNQADMKDIKDIKKYLEAEKEFVLKQKNILAEQASKFETEQDIFRNRLKTLTIENQRLLNGKLKYDKVIDLSSSSKLNDDINVSSPSRFKKSNLPITKNNKKMIEILDEVDDDKTIFSEHTVEKNVTFDSPVSKKNKKIQSKGK